MKRLIVCFLFLLVFLYPSLAIDDYYLPKPQKLPQVKARLAGQELTLMLARTYPQKVKGLMYFKSMPLDFGMLFVYSSNQYMSFWMKNTYIPLDLIFFDDELRIVEWIKGMEPGFGRDSNELPNYSSTKKAKYALELNENSIERFKLKIGDKLEIPLACLYSD